MKTIVPLFILAVCQLCFAGGELAIITVSPWSKPVTLQNEQLHDEAIRGRLLIVQGTEPGYGGPRTRNAAMTFVELQNVTPSAGEGIDLYFNVTNLNCELSDQNGRAVPAAQVSWGGRGPWPPYWVRLPYNSTIRLFINGGSMDPLMLYPSGEPSRYWSIAKSDTNIYDLTGTLSISTRTNSSAPPELWGRYYRGTLVFPKAKVTKLNGHVEKAE